MLQKYDPNSATQFACLDGSKSVPWTAINDDYCDCPDGSDEPGTSACEGRSAARFYCKNEGFEEGWVLASRVNDGICGMPGSWPEGLGLWADRGRPGMLRWIGRVADGHLPKSLC